MDVDIKYGVKLLEKLGSGNFGSVYRCLFANKFYALKKIHLTKSNHKWNFESVKREFALLYKLKHPRIVNMVHYYILDEFNFNFVLEYMEKGSLHDLLMRFSVNSWKLRESDLLSMAADIAAGLKYLHQNGIIHRDLKPGNLLFDTNHRLKIADFGISKMTNDDQSELHTMVGTIMYMAPEVYLQQPYDRAVDIWAFGVIFLEMVLGKYPLTTELKAKILNDPHYKPPHIDFARRNYSSKFQDIIDVCLQKNPKFRWAIEDICHLPAIESYYKIRKDEEIRFLQLDAKYSQQKKSPASFNKKEPKSEEKIPFWKSQFAERVFKCELERDKPTRRASDSTNYYDFARRLNMNKKREM